MANSNNTLYVGLCLAGAVSGGAYTAGVMDYLIEALEEWEKRKRNGESDVPSHRVVIPVIGGASAGGMTGIVTASAINNEIKPVRLPDGDLLKEHPDNKFYHTWVDLEREDMFPLMLENSDIQNNTIYSLLNSNFIDRIAERIIKVDPHNWIERNYFARELKVFTSLSNLEGLSYDINFKSNASGENKYFISRHSDFACFVLNKKESEYNGDGWIPLHFKERVNTPIVMDAAMATGAFPVGLKARRLVRKSRYVNDLSWFKGILKENPINGIDYQTLNVDGGMINNEPFVKVRELLNEITGEEIPQDNPLSYSNFKSTVLMIDPFPSHLSEFEGKDDLLDVVTSTYSAVMRQLQVKPTDLVNAMDSNDAGQYLIAPVRIEKKDNKEKRIQGAKAIACGSLGGFGGFLNKEFRIHDFFLGRANCEKFLRDHFTVPADTSNPVFVEGYGGFDEHTKAKFKSRTDGGLQIIPIFTPRADSIPMPVFKLGKQWPELREEDIDVFKKPLKKRIQAVLLNAFKLNKTNRTLIWLLAKVGLNKKLAKATLQKMKSSLDQHELLEP